MERLVIFSLLRPSTVLGLKSFPQKNKWRLTPEHNSICEKNTKWKFKQSNLFQDLILCSLNLTSSPLMCMKIPSTMKHFFIGNYLNFYYTGIPFPVRRGLGELSTAHGISSSSQQISQWMISQNVHFLPTKFQIGTTSLQISYSLEGGCPDLSLQLSESCGWTRCKLLGSKGWARRERCCCNKQVESKYMLESRNKLQERSSMKEFGIITGRAASFCS